MDESGAAVGDNKAQELPIYWDTSPEVVTYGSNTDKFGWDTPTPAKVNHVNFGVEFIAQNENTSDGPRTVYIDYVTVTVHYDETSPVTNYPCIITDTNYPASSVAWTNPNNTQINDGAYAETTLVPGSSLYYSDYLDTTGYAFNIPTDATILGIKASIKRYATVGSTLVPVTVKLIGPAGNNKGTASYLPTTPIVINYGGATDLWGATLTPAIVNASTFGLRYSLQHANGASSSTGFVDYINLTVYFDTIALSSSSSSTQASVTSSLSSSSTQASVTSSVSSSSSTVASVTSSSSSSTQASVTSSVSSSSSTAADVTSSISSSSTQYLPSSSSSSSSTQASVTSSVSSSSSTAVSVTSSSSSSSSTQASVTSSVSSSSSTQASLTSSISSSSSSTQASVTSSVSSSSSSSTQASATSSVSSSSSSSRSKSSSSSTIASVTSSLSSSSSSSSHVYPSSTSESSSSSTVASVTSSSSSSSSSSTQASVTSSVSSSSSSTSSAPPSSSSSQSSSSTVASVTSSSSSSTAEETSLSSSSQSSVSWSSASTKSSSSTVASVTSSSSTVASVTSSSSSSTVASVTSSSSSSTQASVTSSISSSSSTVASVTSSSSSSSSSTQASVTSSSSSSSSSSTQASVTSSVSSSSSSSTVASVTSSSSESSSSTGVKETVIIPLIPGSTNAKLSGLIESQLPDFIVEDNPGLVNFIKAFYEWEEQQGTLATGTATITNGAVTSIAITNIGSGYIVAPTIKITGGGGSGATAVATIGSGVQTVTITNPGSGYTSAPVVTFTTPEGRPYERIARLPKYWDIDDTIDSFIQYFKTTFMASIPDTILANRRKLVKHIREMYQAKGTENSYRLLFRILFDKPVGFYYPKEDILKSSHGNWVENKSIRVTAISGDPFDLANRQITEAFSGATASVTSVISFIVGSETVYELFLVPSTITGTFTSGKTIAPTTALSATENIVAKIGYSFTGITVSVDGFGYTSGDTITLSGGSGSNAQAIVDDIGNGPIDSISIVDGGTGYAVNERLVITNQTGNVGQGAGGFISEVSGTGVIRRIVLENGGLNYTKIPAITVTTTSGSGASLTAIGSEIGRITSTRVINFGYGYNTAPTSVVFSGGTSAKGTATQGAICTYASIFTDNSGKINSSKYLQDNLYYQDFSYVLKVNETLDQYKDIVIKLLHPAGMKLIGAFFIADLLPELEMWSDPEDRVTDSFAGSYIPIIDDYDGYTSNSTVNVAGNNPHPGVDTLGRFPAIAAGTAFSVIELQDFVRTRWEF